ncbi:hypothetical protein EX30DRAFT_336362 [Ascodesmis nigricans]|uniref:Alpha/beta-hydrolase n=1 Tax=Ascodesmis nigricans TaxID=341454 RepID=A0A4S2MIQ2_9PEZI|nr:hypothetical protein EX30DRAFT_336362 [Ascodesmis nigricans]
MESGTPVPADSPYLSTSTALHLAGLTLTIHGLSHLPPAPARITALHLLHPRLETSSYMNAISHHSLSAHHSTNPSRGLITISFDQRNHGQRLVSAARNEAWKQGNPTHAVDMFSMYHGTSVDVSLIIDYLQSALFADEASGYEIDTHIVSGVSLGGHAAYLCLLNEPRISAAGAVIGCADFAALMTQRAEKTRIVGFKVGGCVQFPRALEETVGRVDFGGVGRKKGWEEVARKVKGKRLLALTGNRDKLVPADCSEEVLRALRKMDGFEIVEKGFDAGHECTPQMVAVLAEWVKGVVADFDGKNGQVKAKY